MTSIHSHTTSVKKLATLIDQLRVTPSEDRPFIVQEIQAIFQAVKPNLTHDEIEFIAERAFFSLEDLEINEDQWETINAIIDLSEPFLNGIVP